MLSTTFPVRVSLLAPCRRAIGIFLFFCGESSFKPRWSRAVCGLYCTREITLVRPVGGVPSARGYGSWGMRMEKLLLEYLPILIFIGVAGVMGGALIVLP